jgi:L-amino acid N-acyltransferase YncA
LANDNAMASLKIAEKVDFQGLGASNEVSKKSSKMA